MKEYPYMVVFEPAEEGGYNVLVPALPGCFTQGASLEQARERAQEAILCHIKGLLKDGEPIPVEPQAPPFVMERILVELEVA